MILEQTYVRKWMKKNNKAEIKTNPKPTSFARRNNGSITDPSSIKEKK